MMKSATLFATLFLSLLAPVAGAQAPVTQPVIDNAVVETRLFALPEEEINHHLRVELPDDNFLLIEMIRMSAWPTDHTLQEITDLAARTAGQFQDSFQSYSSSKTIELSIPENGSPVLVRLRESGQQNRLLVLSGTGSAPLKVTMDTIRILKTYGQRNGEPLQVQYIFLLKNLEDAASLASNTALVQQSSDYLNNLVTAEKKRYRNPDLFTHHFAGVYNPAEKNPAKQFKRSNEYNTTTMLDIDINVGATLFRNQLAPVTDVGYALKMPVDKEYVFVKASLASSYFFHPAGNNNYDTRILSFVNLEAGTMTLNRKTGLPGYQASVGFGYLLFRNSTYDNKPASEVTRPLYRMFFYYSLSKAVSIASNFYLLHQGRKQNHLFVGLTLKVRLLNRLTGSFN